MTINRTVRPDGLPPENGFSHVVRCGDLVFVSGQVPADADGRPVDLDDVEAQCEQVFANLTTALAAEGAGLADVVKLTYFLTDLGDLATFRQVRDRHLDAERLPASSLVEVSALVHPHFRLEVEAVAYLPPGG